MKTYQITLVIKGKEQVEIEVDDKQEAEERAYDFIRELDLSDYIEIKLKEIK